MTEQNEQFEPETDEIPGGAAVAVAERKRGFSEMTDSQIA
jgi:hypothetical protein